MNESLPAFIGQALLREVRNFRNIGFYSGPTNPWEMGGTKLAQGQPTLVWPPLALLGSCGSAWQ